MKHILIVGSNSKLGHVFIDRKGVGESIIATDKNVLDLSNKRSIDDFIKTNTHSFDAVIFFAGIYERMESIADIENIERHLAINTLNPLRLLQGIKLRKNATVIFFTDSGVEQPKKGFLGYSFSKAVLQELIRFLAVELAPFQKVVGISLGPILPDEKTNQKDFFSRPLLKTSSPATGLADFVRFLIHNENVFMTGSIIPFDGGTYIKR